jgi:hypothetical protein
MPAAEPTYCVAEVRIEARDAWRDFCDRQHINRVAFCEVMAIYLTDDRLPPLEQLVREARDLKNQRRRRG